MKRTRTRTARVDTQEHSMQKLRTHKLGVALAGNRDPRASATSATPSKCTGAAPLSTLGMTVPHVSNLKCESWPDHLTMAGMYGDLQLASDGLAEGAAKSVRDLKTLVCPSLLPLPSSSPNFDRVHSR